MQEENKTIHSIRNIFVGLTLRKICLQVPWKEIIIWVFLTIILE